MKNNLLNTRRIAATKKRGYYADGSNLYLQVSEYGTKCWVFRYTRGGRVRDMGLGGYPGITLAQARRLAGECREHLQRGDDPLELRRAKRDQSRAESLVNMTFREAAQRFIDLHAPTWKNEKHRKQWAATLDAYAYRTLGGRPVSAIDGAAITEALVPIWLEKQETASRVKQRIKRVVQWVKDGTPLPQQSASRRVQHHKAIPFEELPAFMAELRERNGISARALELVVLTALRTSEIIEAKWEEIDLKAKTWTVPAKRMKAHKEHVVPLSKRAIEALTALPRLSDYVFPGAKSGHRSNMAMLELLRGMRGNGDTVHGFRSSFRDWAGDRTAFSSETIEFALAHGIPDKAKASYRRYRAIDKRRKLMEVWAKYCTAPVIESATVTHLRRA